MTTSLKNLFHSTTTIGVLIAFFILSSCATLTSDITVEAHTDPDIDLNNYNTYAWAGSAQVVFDPIGQWEQPTLDMDEEVRFVVNRELRDKGLHQVQNNPDLLVVFAAGIDTTVLELKEDPKHADKVVISVPKAALIIALVDANTGYVVWSGYAMGDVQKQQTVDNIRKRIDYAVSEIFKSYNH